MVNEAMPKDWLIHDVKVIPYDSINNANNWQDVNPEDGVFIIQCCRVDSNDALVSLTEGTGGDVTAEQGTYTLFIDAVNSYPLDRLPQLNDVVNWTDGYSNFNATVKSITTGYSDNGVNHWEVVLQ